MLRNQIIFEFFWSYQPTLTNRNPALKIDPPVIPCGRTEHCPRSSIAWWSSQIPACFYQLTTVTSTVGNTGANTGAGAVTAVTVMKVRTDSESHKPKTWSCISAVLPPRPHLADQVSSVTFLWAITGTVGLLVWCSVENMPSRKNLTEEKKTYLWTFDN